MNILGSFVDKLADLHETGPITLPELVKPGSYEQAIIESAREFGGVNDGGSIEDLDFDNLNNTVLELLKKHGVHIQNPNDEYERSQHGQGIDYVLGIVAIKWRLCPSILPICPPFEGTDFAVEIYDFNDLKYIEQHRAYYEWLKSQDAIEPSIIFEGYEQPEVLYEAQQAS